jgi:ADP-dependent phosphofructokinase/glucokinase
MRPYTDIESTKEYIIREFNENIDPIELLWHRDLQNRKIEVIGKTDWKFQLEDQLPVILSENHIFIPKHQWHRLIKGTTGTLKLKIYENETI